MNKISFSKVEHMNCKDRQVCNSRDFFSKPPLHLKNLEADTITFSSKKQHYNWHEKDNWWQEVEKAVKSSGKDKPMILKPEGNQPVLRPTTKKGDWQNVAVYNPGAFYDKLPGESEPAFHILYRASDCCYPNQPSVSRWGMATSKDGINIDSVTDLPLELPKTGYEVWGIEDPRITKVGETYFIAYCAYSPQGPRLGLMSTKGFKNEYEVTERAIHSLIIQANIQSADEVSKLKKLMGKKFSTAEELTSAVNRLGLSRMQDQVRNLASSGLKRHGIIGPNMEDKDVVLFPEKINGKYAMMHRMGHDIQIAYFDRPEDLNDQYWDKYMTEYNQNKSKYTVMQAKFGWEDKLGAGPPPIKVGNDWLFVYHTSKQDKKSGKRIYTAGVAILDGKDPTKVKHRIPHPTMVPVNKYEKQYSICPDKWVVFPTGIAQKGDELYIYSGAGDKTTELYKVKTKDLLNYARQFDADGQKQP